MTSRDELTRQVEDRARGCCEYCRMRQALQGGTFHAEHIVPRSLGGTSDLDNVAWSCPGCNLRKSARIEATDPESGASVAFFSPRADRWADHFTFNGYQLLGRTPVGRATVVVLDLNHPRRLLIRQAEELFGWFPPNH